MDCIKNWNNTGKAYEQGKNRGTHNFEVQHTIKYQTAWAVLAEMRPSWTQFVALWDTQSEKVKDKKHMYGKWG